jgi:hypothetical protein
LAVDEDSLQDGLVWPPPFDDCTDVASASGSASAEFPLKKRSTSPLHSEQASNEPNAHWPEDAKELRLLTMLAS